MIVEEVLRVDEELQNPVQVNALENVRVDAVWGVLSVEDVCQIVNTIDEEFVHWRKNLFVLPSGASGKVFVRGTTARLCNSSL